MNVILENNGQNIEYKTGSALYLLLSFIPLVGPFIVLAMTIMRKQFRGIILNQLVIALFYAVGFFLIAILNSVSLYLIAYLIASVFQIYILVMYVLNANRYSVKARMTEGYRVVNIDQPEVQQFVQEAEAVNKPFWQVTNF